MPRYVFHTNDPSQSDPQAMEFDDIRAAKCESVRYAGRLLCGAAENFWDDADFELTVTDEKGLILFTMRMVGTEAPVIRTTGR